MTHRRARIHPVSNEVITMRPKAFARSARTSQPSDNEGGIMRGVIAFPMLVQRLRSLLLLSLWLTGIIAFAPAAFAQAAPPVPPNPSLFSLPDIMNAPVLVKKLAAQADPASALVWSR